MNSIRSWPDMERPREKLLARGAGALSDAELLAIFLRTGTKGKNALDLAREIISYFGGLKNLLHADKNSFCQFNGLGNAKYAQLQACMEMGKRYLAEDITHGSIFEHASQVKSYIKTQLNGYSNEVFSALFLDNQHRLIAFEVLFTGTINYSHVHPRVVIQKAMAFNAAAIIFAHNHPSGASEISQSDIEITRLLKSLLDALDVRILDHFVLAANQIISMAEQGYI